MEYTHLGPTGLRVSRITLGCMSFGNGNEQQTWTLDAAAAEPIFRRAVELGIDFWDTANVYGRGSSEEVTGAAIREYTRREDVVLATKVFGEMGPGPGESGLSRRAILEQVDKSLQRLGTDWIDLYQIHRFDPETPVEETMEALHDVIQAGKVRYIGASSMWAWQFAKLQAAADLGGWTRFVSMQNQYSLVQREEEREMFGLLADQGVGSIPWGPLQAGKLARPWSEQNTARAGDEPERDPKGNPVRLDSDEGIVDAVARIADERGVSMAQVALAWVLRNPVVDAPIVGATKVHHIEDAAAALDVHLTDDEAAALEEHYVARQPTFF
ncbi:aldo/keto reductase [Curtobacterium sp. MCBD17_019]|uniref:aldo/keto reductase n=1 Tax=Curtobacterium sp. MCBD17_019 TaxID=2175669 RepID=UPI000DA819DE|nr:aldo/keto reductase [Curtobacterium sp. MCBD17_019]PZE73457.1 aldo/keto reductase [Curtobacterium sp. MCBD17_019]